MSEKYKSLKVKELTELLQKYKLSTSGKKEELIDRLVKYDEKQAIEKLEKEFELDFQNDTSSTSKIDLDDVAFSSIPLDTKTPPNLKESVLSDDEDLDLIMDPPSSSAKTVNTVTSSTSIKAATVRPDAKTVPATVKTVKSEMTKATHTAVKTTKKTTSTITTADTATALNNDSSGATITATPGKSDIKDTKFKFTPITFDKKEPEKPKTKEELEAERFKTEAEKKYERSKRFGVKLDDTEMKVVRAARFNLPIKPTTDNTKGTTAIAIKGKENKKGNKAKKDTSASATAALSKPKQKQKDNNMDEVLRKRAERFGLPASTSAENKKTKKEAKPVLQGRITKKDNVRMNVTKDSVLNKKQRNLNRLSKSTIAQKKKDIVQQRRVNLLQRQQQTNRHSDRVVTIGTAPSPPPLANNNKRNVIITRNTGTIRTVNNPRNVIIAATPNNKNATRKRGREGAALQPTRAQSQNQKSRGNDYRNNKRRRY